MGDDVSEAELDQCKELFAFFDLNGDNSICAKEIGTVLRCMGQNPTDAEIQVGSCC